MIYTDVLQIIADTESNEENFLFFFPPKLGSATYFTPWLPNPTESKLPIDLNRFKKILIKKFLIKKKKLGSATSLTKFLLVAEPDGSRMAAKMALFDCLRRSALRKLIVIRLKLTVLRVTALIVVCNMQIGRQQLTLQTLNVNEPMSAWII